MKILILANNDIGLYQFRKELIAELLKDNKVTISLPYGKLVDELIKMGCSFVDTQMERRGMNPFRDIKLLFNYFSLIKSEKPDLVITYTIKPNVYGGIVCRLLKIPYATNITGLGTTFQGNGLLRKFVVLLYKLGLKKAKTVFFENAENMKIFLDEKICKVFKFNGPIDMDFFYRDGQYYLSEINPRFGGAYLHAYGAGVDFIKLIDNNLNGNINTANFGNYEEGVVMMMYDSVVIKRNCELIK